MEFNATFFVSAISFILFTIIMNLIFYKPISKVIYERQKLIGDALTDAQNSKEKAQELLTNRDYRLNKSAMESRKLIADKIEEANKNSKLLTQKAKLKSQQDIAFAKADLNNQVKILNSELDVEVKNLAEIISSNILGIDIKIEDSKYNE